jgi:NAD(P)H dehydrogenase (quinone)
MKASVILAHPHPGSFNHAIFSAVCGALARRGVTIHAHDLYAEDFDPVLTEDELGSDRSPDPLVNRYAEELVGSDLLFFIHPNWWGQPPAIMKGYIDRVIRPPHCYDFPPGDAGGGLPIGKLKGKCGVVFNTSNTEREREEACFGDPLERTWKQCVFGFCGIERSYRAMFRIVADSDDRQRKAWLDEAESVTIKAIDGLL